MSATFFPRIRIQGKPYARGQQYGQKAKAFIRHSLDAYRLILGHYNGWSWERVQAQANAHLPAIGNYRPHMLDELQGIADGAGLPLADILAINVRTENINAALADLPAHECTAFFTNSGLSEDRHIFLGQNWDWKPATAGSIILLEVEPDEGPNFITVVEGGLLAKMGINAAGIGLVTNALVSDADRGQPDVPYHVILRAILESESFNQAAECVRSARRASAANYLLANQDGQALDMEAGPGQAADNLFEQPAQSGYVHTNHYLCAALPFVDKGLEQGDDSPIREQRLRELLLEAGTDIELEAIQSALGDHHNYPYSICCHPDHEHHLAEQYATLASLVMDLPTRQCWLANGNPCQTAYHKLDYSGFLAGF